MIVVTGANGQLGRAVVERLLTRVPAEQVGVSVRDASKAQALADKGVRVREGSFTEPSTLAHSFEGADTVLVISTDVMGDPGVAASRAGVAAAVEAGATRVVYTSHMGCSADSAFQACRDHAAVEETLAGCGVAWTALRNGFYAGSAIQFAGHGLASGDVAVPADGPVSWTTHADLAEAAAIVLSGEQTYEGPTPPLTAAGAWSFDDIARIASQQSGREITRSVVDDEDWVRGMVGYGAPEVVARQLLGIFQAARAGELSAVDPTLGRLLGHEPQGIDLSVREALSA